MSRIVECSKSRIVSADIGTVEEHKVTNSAEPVCMELCLRNETDPSMPY
jgi:hypothetical protein